MIQLNETLSKESANRTNRLLLWHTKRLIIFIITPLNAKLLYSLLIGGLIGCGLNEIGKVVPKCYNCLNIPVMLNTKKQLPIFPSLIVFPLQRKTQNVQALVPRLELIMLFTLHGAAQCTEMYHTATMHKVQLQSVLMTASGSLNTWRGSACTQRS